MSIADLVADWLKCFKIGSEDDGYAPKQGQIDVISSVISSDPEEPTVGIYHTGYGKSSCFGVLSEVFKKYDPDTDHTVTLVVSPLTGLMNNQAN